jgi:Tol biopolymer transport system component
MLTGGNPDGSFELFLFNIATNTFTQITNTTGGSFAHRFNPAISINADGTRVAFIFDRDLTGANTDLNGEVFLFDTTTSTITQITNTVGSSQYDPWISGSGTRIVFSSSAGRTEFCPGGCADLFLFDTTTNTTTQITQATGRTVQHGSISADGTRIVFSSDADLTGGNPEHSSKIFLFDTTTNSFTQITSSPGEFPVS